MLYEKMKAANKNRDIDAFMELVHEDFVFVRNQNGTAVNSSILISYKYKIFVD